MGDIGLADAVAAVRRELLQAAAGADGEALRFEVGPIEMEFEVELRAEARGRGGFRVWALAADAEAGVARGRTHRVSFTMTPRTAASDSESADENLLISAPDD